jgi:hypothetical protein
VGAGEGAGEVEDEQVGEGSVGHARTLVERGPPQVTSQK